MVVLDYSTFNAIEEKIKSKECKDKIHLTFVRDINNIGKLYNVRTFKMPTGELEIFFTIKIESKTNPVLLPDYYLNSRKDVQFN